MWPLRCCSQFAALLMTALAASMAAADLPSNGSAGSEPNTYPNSGPNGFNYHPQDVTDSALRAKLVASITEELSQLKPAGGKREENDWFAFGTIDLQDHQAKVEYPIVQGLRKTAEQIADFMSTKPEDAVRQYRIFGRSKTEKLAQGIVRKARAQSIEGQLEIFKITPPGKRSDDDTFVVGTGVLFKSTRHADIRFEIVKGVKATGNFLLDFILTPEQNTEREWHVFFRCRTEDQATEYRTQLRQWYDTLEAQRSQIAAIYHAKTTRRC
jgi:hypothetical protein